MKLTNTYQNIATSTKVIKINNDTAFQKQHNSPAPKNLKTNYERTLILYNFKNHLTLAHKKPPK